MGDETLLDPLISPMSSVYSHVIVRDVSEQNALVASGQTTDESRSREIRFEQKAVHLSRGRAPRRSRAGRPAEGYCAAFPCTTVKSDSGLFEAGENSRLHAIMQVVAIPCL
ncbi:MAG TPA: hypothetical protein VFV38_52305 [Ktedonobacteraceae bacterium]|nr:hypothetical protein [Ktedonobacteraceae bacterium]